ncbi:MAG: DUF2252 domain-containing protein [Methylophilaceae bacterium]|nr:DUF2252 domain-containing protein [Methylophilaceae bacterium]
MTNLPVKQRINAYNHGRDHEILAFKYKAIQDNEFSFYRGTCHLFYEDLPQIPLFTEAPHTWILGDCHLENFGTYKGSNRLSYFDLNDCDEAALAPCTWELARFLVSVVVGAETLRLSQKQALALCDTFLDFYINTLKAGEAYWIERSTSTGMIRQLLMSLKKRSRIEFIKSRTFVEKGNRLLTLNDGKTLPASKEAKARVTAFMLEFANQQTNSEFFKVLDIGRRIAGIGSLGMERYVILVVGNSKKVKDNYYLLDLKLCGPSALKPTISALNKPIKQPSWASEAERVVTTQRRLQAVSPAFLSAVNIDDKSYVLRELHPTQDRLSLNLADGKVKPLQEVIKSMGEIVAWAQLRSSGRQGSAIADQLIQFAEQPQQWRKDLLDYATKYAKVVHQDWLSFRGK